MQIISNTIKRITMTDLKYAARYGQLCSILHSGDKIPFKLRDDSEYAVIVTKDQSDRWFLLFEDCLPTTKKYNQRDTTEGGWAASSIRAWLNNEFINSLPDELLEIMSPIDLRQLINGNRNESSDKIFLPSYTQVFGGNRFAEQDVGDSMLDIFKTRKGRIAFRNDELAHWWLRSVNSATHACLVYYDGYANGFNASTSFGVRPLSFIGQS